MKHLNSKAVSTCIVCSLLMGAHVAPAQVTTSQNPTTLVGSDTMIDIMRDVMAEIPINHDRLSRPRRSPRLCYDEVTLATEFYDNTTVVQDACFDNGFIPLADSLCVGADGSAGCGRPTVQAKSACLPQ